MAAVLSFFIPGLGQIYKGSIGKGLLLLVVTVIGYALLILPGLVIHLLTVVDAYSGRSAAERRAQEQHVIVTRAAQPPIPTRPMSRGTKIALLTGGAILMLFAVGGRLLETMERQASYDRGSDLTVLNITAAKGPLSVSVTNREGSALRACDLSVRDAEGTEWSVDLTRWIQPLETVDVQWNEFTANKQSMPGYLGRNRAVRVSCFVTGANVRRDATFR